MAHYGIIGSGTCGENIIEDCLSEIGVENNVFLVRPRRGASDNEDRIYDYLLENEADYIAYLDGPCPDVIKDGASKVFDCEQGKAEHEILQTLASKKGTLLLMWDNDAVEHMHNVAFAAADLGIDIKELTNGLAPIVINEPAKPATLVENSEVAEVEPFTEAELRSMSVGILRQAATNQGIDNATNMSKDELIRIMTVVEASGEVPEDIKPSQEHSKQVMLVWYENGDLQIEALPYSALDVIQDALGRG